jgi:hypothetical protein
MNTTYHRLSSCVVALFAAVTPNLLLRFVGRTAMTRTSALLFCLCVPLFGSDTLPIRGLHLSAPRPEDLALSLRFIGEALPKEGVNTLVLEFNYGYQFARRPEVAETRSLSKADVQAIAEACRKAGVRLIPQINLFGHQSSGTRTAGLLRSHPEFDETPGQYPD